MAHIVYHNNFFDPSDRIIEEVDGGTHFIDWLISVFPDGFDGPKNIYKNGELLPVEDFDTYIDEHDLIEIRPRIGDPGTLTIIVSSLIVAAAAAYIAVQLLPDPEAPSALGGNTSPTYNLRAQSNQARIGEAIPVIYGRNRVYPDLAAVPWAEYEQDNQFLNQLFCIGHGEFDVEEIKIDDTPISDFLDITAEIVPPGQFVTLFDDNIITSIEVKRLQLYPPNAIERNGQMKFDGTNRFILLNNFNNGDYQRAWNISFTIGDSITVRNSSDPVYDGEYIVEGFIDEDKIVLESTPGWPAGLSATVSSTVRLSEFTDNDDIPNEGYYGPFTTNTIATIAQTLYVDVEFPTGLYHADSGGKYEVVTVDITIVYERLDDNDVVLETLTDNLSISRSTPQPVRLTHEKTGITEGRYRVKVKRTSTSLLDQTTSDTMYWVGLRAKLQNIQNYGNLTMVAIRMKATNQLDSVSSKKINMIVTRKLPVWDGTQWLAPQATRSIAWAIADCWMNAYGGARSFYDLDLDKFLELDATWALRGDYFDGIFDQQITLWEGLTKIARVGRAKPVLSNTILTLVRDELKPVRTSMFNERNIVRDSFSISYNFDDNRAPDGVRLKFISSDTFQEAEVQPNVDSTRPKTATLFGCTEYEQCYREALYMEAALRKQRKQISFSTELDGHIPMFGDRVAITHNMPKWGVGGEVVSFSMLSLTLSEPVKFELGKTYNIILRRPDGSVEPPIEVTEIPSLDNNQVLLSQYPSFQINQIFNEERTYFAFGELETFSQDAIVTEVAPSGNKRLKITAVNYDESIHSADQVTIPPFTAPPFPVDPIPPAVTGIVLTNVNNSGQVLIRWNPVSTTFDTYQIETSIDDENWTIETNTTDIEYILSVAGLVFVRVGAVVSGSVGKYTKASINAT